MTDPRTQIVADGYDAIGETFETNTQLLREAGFELLRNEVVTFEEPEGPVDFQWILGRR